MLVNLSAYMSQGVGRLRHYHETLENTPDYVSGFMQFILDNSFVLSIRGQAD